MPAPVQLNVAEKHPITEFSSSRPLLLSSLPLKISPGWLLFLLNGYLIPSPAFSLLAAGTTFYYTEKREKHQNRISIKSHHLFPDYLHPTFSPFVKDSLSELLAKTNPIHSHLSKDTAPLIPPCFLHHQFLFQILLISVHQIMLLFCSKFSNVLPSPRLQ